MSKDADPLQGVVTRRDCAHEEGSVVPSAPLPAGAAALEADLATAKRALEWACSLETQCYVEYWTSEIERLEKKLRTRGGAERLPAGNGALTDRGKEQS